MIIPEEIGAFYVIAREINDLHTHTESHNDNRVQNRRPSKEGYGRTDKGNAKPYQDFNAKQHRQLPDNQLPFYRRYQLVGIVERLKRPKPRNLHTR